MKKKRLYNRIGCAVIALVMILSLGLSPLMTMETSAEGEGLTIEVLEDTPTKFEETGEPIDMSQYFTACYDGAEVYGMYDSRNSDEYWFESGNFAETMNIQYFDAGGKPIANAPSEPGSYSVTAEFADNVYYVYLDESWNCAGWVKPDEESKATIEYTIEEKKEPSTYEGLIQVYGLDEKELKDEDAFILFMVGDGFTDSEQQKFYENASEIAEYIMDTSPWDEFKDVVKVYAYGTASEDSGARGEDAETQTQANADKRNTYFGTSFWYGGMQRLLATGTEGQNKVNALKESECPNADFSVIIVNSDKYGGSGGDICVASLNTSCRDMMIHELGHTVANLGDEYWPDVKYAMDNYYPNMSSESDPAAVPWSRFVGMDGVGVYKYVQTQTTTDWYHPGENCKMQYLDAEFCEVCKEALRQAFCAKSNVTKMFFQTYADAKDFYPSAEGKNMSEYFILRKGDNETTGDKLDGALNLEYFDQDGNPINTDVNGFPHEAGTYKIRATYTSNDKYPYDTCSMEVKYTIKLQDLISFDIQSREYNGKPVEPENVKIDYEGTTDCTFYYEGTLLNYASYSSETPPSVPGKYSVTATLRDENGIIISEKTKKFEITVKKTQLVNNDSSIYIGAQDTLNNQHIVIVGEGFTAEEQDEFEKLAQEYADYILSTEPFKETKLYFDFTSGEAISEESGLGGNTFFGLTCDKNGNLDPDKVIASRSAVSNIGYYNVSMYYKAGIIIVNDKNVKGTVVDDGYRGYIYAGNDTDGKEYVARELLNYLTDQEEGYVADTEEKVVAQRYKLIENMYITTFCEDCPIIVSRAYDERFVENGSPILLDDYFHTYVQDVDGDGVKEVPQSELNYKLTYYDSNGNVLEKAPSKAGSYSVLYELIPNEDQKYYFDDDENVWKLDDDKRVDDEGDVYNSDNERVGYIFYDDVQEVMVDGVAYHIPLSRGETTFTIQPANSSDDSGNSGGSGTAGGNGDGSSTGTADNNGDGSNTTSDSNSKAAAKTGDTAPIALYLILLAGAVVAGGTVVVKRRKR